MASPDIFKFWERIGRGERIHPADRDVFSRIDASSHGFRLECLPSCFSGRLRNAPVVLLFLSPGFSERDISDAESELEKDRYFRRWKGCEPLPGEDGAGFDWWRSRTRLFSEKWQTLQDKIAILNIGAYHSQSFQRSYHTLAALPSSRACLDWAQKVLFPEALEGKRIVVCLRAASYWGLDRTRRYSGDLFAPPVTPGGHLVRGELRDHIVELVKRRIGTQN